MKIASVRIDGGEPIDLTMECFVTIQVAHAHLFKHLVGIGDMSPAPSLTEDPEGWAEIIGSPPLEKSFAKRKAEASQFLAGVTGCTLLDPRENQKCPCYSCKNETAQREIDLKMRELTAAYVHASGEAMAWCFRNPSSSGPRVVAYWKQPGRLIRIVAQDNRGVRTVADMKPANNQLHAISCFRRKKPTDYTSNWLEMCREQSGYRRQGLAVKLKTVQGEQNA